MPSNIEIKATVSAPARLFRLAEAVSDIPPVRIEQRDTYFTCPCGRLKLRQSTDHAAQIIFYIRPDSRSPKRSDFTICEIADPVNLLGVLAGAIGIRATVIKTRTLFIVGQTRIHLDHVEGLGWFVELEVVLQESQPDGEGWAIARKLMALLEIRECDIIGGSYVDLLPDKRKLEESLLESCGRSRITADNSQRKEKNRGCGENSD